MNDPLALHDPGVLAEAEASVRADLHAGVALEHIVASLEAVGWTHEEASALVARVEAARLTHIADIQDRYAQKYSRFNQRARSGAVRHIATGAFLLVLGIGATIGSYLLSRNGGMYVITWGIIAVGAIRLLTGLSDLRSK